MNWKIFSIMSFLLVIPIVIIWQVDSSDYGETLMFSRDSKQTEVKTYDEIFDEEVIEIETEEGFWLGLLPGDDTISFKALLGVVPLSGIAVVLGGFGIFMHIRSRKKAKQ